MRRTRPSMTLWQLRKFILPVGLNSWPLCRSLWLHECLECSETQHHNCKCPTFSSLFQQTCYLRRRSNLSHRKSSHCSSGKSSLFYWWNLNSKQFILLFFNLTRIGFPSLLSLFDCNEIKSRNSQPCIRKNMLRLVLFILCET